MMMFKKDYFFKPSVIKKGLDTEIIEELCIPEHSFQRMWLDNISSLSCQNVADSIQISLLGNRDYTYSKTSARPSP